MIDPLHLVGLAAVGIAEDQHGFNFHPGLSAPAAFDQYQIGRKLRPVAHQTQTLGLKAVAAHGAENLRQPLRLVYQSKSSAVAYSVWSLLMKYNPVSRVSVFGFTNPVFGVLLSALLLGERSQAFGAQGLIALALVCAGILVVNRGKKE